jgi:hypothetical protein
MQSKEFTNSKIFPPDTPHELVERALAYIDENGKVRRKLEDGQVLVSGPFTPVDLDELPNDVWLHTLLTVAWVLFRQHRHDVPFDEETLQILAIYLGAYRHDPLFLEAACSLIHSDTQSWESPSLPGASMPQAIVSLLRR